jgi:hypothetical protein
MPRIHSLTSKKKNVIAYVSWQNSGESGRKLETAKKLKLPRNLAIFSGTRVTVLSGGNQELLRDHKAIPEGLKPKSLASEQASLLTVALHGVRPIYCESASLLCHFPALLR